MPEKTSLKKMVLSLTGISVVAALFLGAVHHLTAETIAATQKQTEINAAYAVTGIEAENNLLESRTFVNLSGNSDRLEVYPIRQNGYIRAFAIKTNSRKGFGGKMELMVGISIDGVILNYEVLKHQETPGLGTKIAEEKFKTQFVGLSPKKDLKIRQDGGEIDAVTAATISSRAATEAVQRAYTAYRKLSSKGERDE